MANGQNEETQNEVISSYGLEPAEALEAIQCGSYLLDVRTQEEFDSGHLAGAVNIPHDQLANRLTELKEFKEKKVVLYCKSGGRSQFGTELLRAAGFKDSWNAGGYKELFAEQNRAR